MTHSLMKALVLPGVDATFETREIPLPVPGEGQVLVRIVASGVNPLDTKVRAGKAAHAKQALPAVLGMDLAGTVVSVGAGVTAFKAGDEVFGMAGGIGGLQGTLAEYAAVDERLIALKPSSLSMREAAALPLAVITAWEGLIDRAQLGPGQKVLVQGGAGGVGHVVIQLAKARGAQVFATGSAGQAATIEKLGATPIDYQSTSVEQYVQKHTQGRGFDIVYDTVGGPSLDASFTAVRKYGGHVLSILGWGAHSLAPLSFRAATYSGVFTLIPMLTGEGREHHGEILRGAAALAEAGQLRPILDGQQFGFDQATQAHEYVAAGRTHGKVVVDIVAA